MHDFQLMITESARAAVIPGAGWGKATLPDLLAPNFLDLKTQLDWARGRVIYGNFVIVEAFNNQAGNFLRPAVFASDDPSFVDVITNDELVVATHYPIASLGLATVGDAFSVAIPPFDALTRVNGQGRRYWTLGYEYLVPTTDWTTGKFMAFFSDKPIQQRPFDVPVGY